MPKITTGVQPEEGLCGKQPSRSNSSDRFAQLESDIRNGQGNYVIVGAALLEIQSTRMYKTKYTTFEEYCEKQWGFTRDTAYDYINAYGVAQNVDLSPQKQPSLTQARELARLEPEQQRVVAGRFDFQTETVRAVKADVDQVLGKTTVPKPREPIETLLEDALDAFILKIVMQSYGYGAAKFTMYVSQHPSDLAIIEQAKVDIGRQLMAILRARLE